MFIGIARFYGPEIFGQFTFVHTLATIFLLVADFGLDVFLTTEIARQRNRANEIFQRFFSLKFIVSSIAVLGMWIVPVIHPVNNSTLWLIGIFSFYVAFTAITNFYFALFKGFEQLQYETKVSFVNNIILLCVLVVLGLIGASIHLVACAFVGIRIIGLFTSFQIASKLLPNQSYRLNFSGWKEIRNQVFTFGFHLFFGNLFFVLDTILLAFWRGNHEVGIYQSAFRLITVFLIIPEVIINALLPVLSRFYVENKENWANLSRLMNKTLFLSGMPIALFFCIYAEQIIYFVYGTKAFSDAIPILRLFGIVLMIRFSVETYALMLTTSYQQKSRMVVVVIATIINFLLNLYAIPSYGPYGAALVSLITNFLVGVGYIIATQLTRQFFLRWLVDVRSITLFIFTSFLAFILWNIKDISFLYVSPIVFAVYLFVYYYFGYTKDERKLVFAKERLQ